jgi:NAD(P) transhydrogenase subunit beta
MPILDVDHAKTIVVIMRSIGHGRAGIDIELHTNPKTRVYFADARRYSAQIMCAIKTLVG